MAVRHLSANNRNLPELEWPQSYANNECKTPVSYTEKFPKYDERMQAINDITLLQYRLIADK